MKVELGMIIGFATLLVCIMGMMLIGAGLVVPGLTESIVSVIDGTDLLVLSGIFTWGGAVLLFS